eukprot:8198029-Karenia_brevis.AAC.1
MEDLGLDLREDKCKCFSFGMDLQQCAERPAHMPLGRIDATNGRVGFGIVVAGVPIGDQVFVDTFLGGKTQMAMSKMNTIVNQLRDVHLPSLWTCLYYAMQPLFLYWVQHCYPRDCQEHAHVIDDALFQVAAICIPGLKIDDEITVRRLQLPARMYGGGLRSLVHLSPAAFSATVCRALPRMIDSSSIHGERNMGFLPPLTPVLGAGSFDATSEARWFAQLLTARTRVGEEFASAWRAMQSEVGEPIPGSTLADAPANAGRKAYRVQAGLTRARERSAFQDLDVLAKDLAPDDARRLAWLNVDRYSASWVASWPCPDQWMQDSEFMEITCRYFGLPSPACAQLVGQPIGRTRAALDKYGFRLCSATLPGDGWRSQHDAIKWTMYDDLRSIGTRVTPEVYGLFAPLLPQVARDEMETQPLRKRQGIVPDIMLHCRADVHGPFRDTLVEFKTLHYGSSTYPATEERCRAVARRAAAVDAEYVGKARALDQRWHGTAENGVGPVETKLRSYGGIRAI